MYGGEKGEINFNGIGELKAGTAFMPEESEYPGKRWTGQ